jgi:hypothetical protein
MAELFQKDVRTINEHIQNVFADGELSQESVIRKFRITAADGKIYETQHYNLDVIISVGYRVKSPRGTQFRIWATQRSVEGVMFQPSKSNWGSCPATVDSIRTSRDWPGRSEKKSSL